MPTEPPPTTWQLVPPPPDHPDDLWATGADLEPGTILAAYRLGLFPMPLREEAIGWWSPALRGTIPLDRRPPRTVRRVAGRYPITVDTRFEEVVRGCADPGRPHGWIDDQVVAAYVRLHELGWARSIECLDEEGRLVGGLYGLAIGGLFAAESMFQLAPDAAKCALHALVERLQGEPDHAARLLDVQWRTPHLALLGAEEIRRDEYVSRLHTALSLPPAHL